jgi:hypothetical protein
MYFEAASLTFTQLLDLIQRGKEYRYQKIEMMYTGSERDLELISLFCGRTLVTI